MPSLTTTYDRIIRQPALTMPGNATGSEAACTALTGSQIRAICGLGTTDNVTFNTVTATTSVLTPLVNNASAALTLGNSTYGVTVPGAMETSSYITTRYTGSPIIWNIGCLNSAGSAYKTVVNRNDLGTILTASTGIYGWNSATSFSFNSGLDTGIGRNSAGVVEVNNGSLVGQGGSYAGFMAGAATFSGNLTASGSFHTFGGLATSSYINITSGSAANNFYIGREASGALISVIEAEPLELRTSNIARLTISGSGDSTFSGDISMQKATQGYIRAYGPGGVKNIAMYDDDTSGILTTSSGNLNLVPNGGTVAVTGGITASGAIQETYRTSSLDPTVSDIGSGKRQGWYNTSSLEFRDWVNVSGTLYKSAAYT